MGVKTRIPTFPYKYKDLQMQTMTVKYNIGFRLHLHNISKQVQCIYEPELFPALQLTKFKPLCVNIFSSGCVIILGVRDLRIVSEVIKYISTNVVQ